VESVHFLVTYRCSRRCPHCFVYGSPDAPGEMTGAQVREYLRACVELGIRSVFFEGGEAFLLYDRLADWVETATAMGIKAGALTNGFWAERGRKAAGMLARLKDAGLASLMISTDEYHGGAEESRRARVAEAAARAVGIPATVAVTGIDGVRFRGRAAGRLARQMPQRSPGEMTCCPYERLDRPGRVHVDAFGYVHLCQGLAVGRAGSGDELRRLIRDYRPEEHPIAGPLLRGGPLELAKVYGLEVAAGYADACQMCYLSRRALRAGFPQFLGPEHVYGEGEPEGG